VYPVPCAISSSVSPALRDHGSRWANASRAVAYHATRSQLRWRQGAWREVPTQDGVGGVGFLYAVIAFGPQSAWAGGSDDGDNDNQLIERYR
jgi:hypothetical protein